jgi:hypothetical protein
MGILAGGQNYKFLFNYQEWDKTSQVIVKDDGIEEFSVTSEELLEVIVTCGMPAYYVKSSSSKINRYEEILFKQYLIETALKTENDYLAINNEKLQYLDSSERGVISYYLGMFITKLISKKKFKQDYLVHLSILEKTNSVIYTPNNTKVRPDFIGFSNTNSKYSVFESKARKNNVKATLKKAVDQVLAVKYINGDKPENSVANMIFFNKEKLHAITVDPPPHDEITITVDQSKFLKAYYQPIVELIRESGGIRCQNKLISSSISLGDFDLSIEIPEIIYRKAVENNLNSSDILEYRESEDLTSKTSDLVKVMIKNR